MCCILILLFLLNGSRGIGFSVKMNLTATINPFHTLYLSLISYLDGYIDADEFWCVVIVVDTYISAARGQSQG